MKAKIIAKSCIIVTLCVVSVTYFFGPDEVPLHWNIQGEVTEWGASWTLFLFPIGQLALYALLSYLPKVDPKRQNYDQFKGTYDGLLAVLMLFFTALAGLICLAAYGFALYIPTILTIMMGLLFLYIGNVLPKIQPNFFIGIRTPWTLSNEVVWRRTHRMAGRVWVVGSLVIILSTGAPLWIGAGIMLASILVLVIAPLIYSYQVFKAEEQAAHRR